MILPHGQPAWLLVVGLAATPRLRKLARMEEEEEEEGETQELTPQIPESASEDMPENSESLDISDPYPMSSDSEEELLMTAQEIRRKHKAVEATVEQGGGKEVGRAAPVATLVVATSKGMTGRVHIKLRDDTAISAETPWHVAKNRTRWVPRPFARETPEKQSALDKLVERGLTVHVDRGAAVAPGQPAAEITASAQQENATNQAIAIKRTRIECLEARLQEVPSDKPKKKARVQRLLSTARAELDALLGMSENSDDY